MPESLPPNLSPEDEASRLLEVHEGQLPPVIGLVERQLNALHARAQVIIGFAAVVVTTTGFSGRLIAGTSSLAQACIITGLSIVMLSCFWIFLRVLTVEWVVSRGLGPDPLASVAGMIRYRDRKTRAYRQGGFGVFLGFAIYALSIALMLSNPEPLTVPVR